MKRGNLHGSRSWSLFLLVAVVALISLGCTDGTTRTGGTVNPIGAYQPTTPLSGSPTVGSTQDVGKIDIPIISIPQQTDGRNDHTNAPLLDNWHPGWQQVDCFGCHTDQSRIPDHSYPNTDMCYLCHGTNGLPGFGDDIPPIIKGVVTNPTANSVTITWKTDEPTITRLIVRTKEGDVLEFPVDGDYSQSHKFIVNGLLAETSYNFEIRATDRNNNMTSTSQLGLLSFTTLKKAPDVTTTGPATADLFFTTFSAKLGDDNLSLQVDWSTRESSTSEVVILRPATNGTQIEGPYGPSTNFSQRYTGVAASATYRIWVNAKDTNGVTHKSTPKEVFVPPIQ